MNEELRCNLHNAAVDHDIFLPHQFEGRLEGPDTGGGNADIYRVKLNAVDPPRKLTGVIRGLAHVHKLLVVHGDLKASNVLVNDAGTVAKLCDFGSSRIDCACDCGLENQCGTLPWDSPELFEGDVRTTMSDMWAFGCIALEAQFGKVPYNANFLIAYRKMRKNLPPATRESVVSVDFISNAVWETMQRCWEFDPQSRPSAQAVLAEFEELESDDNSQPTITIPQNVVLGID
ncbi:hypothetical protein FRC09_016783 [Ceratobasidium sp. 395]|nr:hypothetical protein FRC09_016783 [Ceratobasidium sp. 395]